MIAKRIVLMVALLCFAACTADSKKAPSPSGPSGFGQELTVTASPDIVLRDGQAQSTIQVRLSDSTGASLANRTIYFGATGGTLAALSGKTDASGKVSVTFTAPAAGPTQTITVHATLEGTDFRNAASGFVSILLLQPQI